MEVTWTEFKKFVDARWLSIQYVEISGNYHMKAIDGYFELECILPIGVDNADTNDFEANYKAAGNKSFSDVDGTPNLRMKAAKKGWVYALIPMEATTSTVGGVDSKLVDGTDRAGISIKIYDSDDAEITDPANEGNAVKTVLSFEPTYDYEIIGGQLQQIEKPTTDIHVWIIAVPDVPAAYGGSKEMIGGVDLKFIDPTDKLQADGRVSKLMSYSATYHTNKLHAVLKHGAGVKHSFMMCIELFHA